MMVSSWRLKLIDLSKEGNKIALWFNKKQKTINNNLSKKQNFMYINHDFKTFLSTFTNNYEIDVVKSTINRIASDIAQLKAIPQCVEKENIKTTNKYNLKYLLNVRPNLVMSAYDFYYKITTNLFLQGNTFIYIQWENDKINSLIPIEYDFLEISFDKNNQYFIKFYLNNTNLVLPYDDLIHLRKFYNKGLFGEIPNKSLEYSTKLLEEMINSSINNLKQSGNLKGILKVNNIVAPEQLQEKLKEFVDNNLQNKYRGFAILDNGLDFQEVDCNISNLNKEQMEQYRNNIYNFYNVASEIVNGKYNPEQYQGYVSSVIQPLLTQWEQEFSFKIFSKKELELGNYISFSAKRVLLGNLQDKTAYYAKMLEHSVLSPNEVRNQEGYESVEGLDIYGMTKNSDWQEREQLKNKNIGDKSEQNN